MWKLSKNKKGYISFANTVAVLLTLLICFAGWAAYHYLSEPETNNIVQQEDGEKNYVDKILQGPKIFQNGRLSDE